MGYPGKEKRKLATASVQDERVQTLIGERGKTPTDKMAITREDAAALGNIAILSTYAAAAPTQAEYNTMVDDMKAIASVLNRMGAKFTGL